MPDEPDAGSPGTFIARGREAAVYDLGDGTVLKVFDGPMARPGAEREAAALAALAELGIAAPRLVDVRTVDGLPSIAMTRVAGTDWLSRLGRRPQEATVLGRWLAIAHARVHESRAPDGLETVRDQIAGRLGRSTVLDAHQRARALALLGSLRDGSALLHGDFHLENLLGPLGAPTVIDWVNASSGPPAADVARTDVILRFGELPDGAPRLVRAIAPLARSAILRRYLVTYRRRCPGALEDLDAWRTVHATARMGETTETEAAAIRAWLARQPSP